MSYSDDKVNSKSSGGGGMDPVTGGLIISGIGALGGLFGGGAPDDHSLEVARTRSEYERYIAELQAREAQRQYNIQQAQNVTRQLEQLPMRDQINYLVQQRLGMAPSAFQPRDIYNPGTSAVTPQQGGLDLDQYRQAASAYQPGMGGLDPVYEMYQTMGADLGYGNEPLMHQQGVFGGNRNPQPGGNFDASMGPGSRPPLPPLNQMYGQSAIGQPFNPYTDMNKIKDPAKQAANALPYGGAVRTSENYAPPIQVTPPNGAASGNYGWNMAGSHLVDPNSGLQVGGAHRFIPGGSAPPPPPQSNPFLQGLFAATPNMPAPWSPRQPVPSQFSPWDPRRWQQGG